jgi:hypothetical protein
VRLSMPMLCAVWTLAILLHSCPTCLKHLLKNIARLSRILWSTYSILSPVDWGIIYWRQNPVDSQSRINLHDVPIDPSLPMFPTHDLLWLTGYVDAAHVTDSRHIAPSLAMSLPWLVAPSHSSQNCKPPLLPVQPRQHSWLLWVLLRLPSIFNLSFMS